MCNFCIRPNILKTACACTPFVCGLVSNFKLFDLRDQWPPVRGRFRLHLELASVTQYWNMFYFVDMRCLQFKYKGRKWVWGRLWYLLEKWILYRKRKRSRTRLVGEREWSAGGAERCIARAKVAVVGAATARRAASDQTWRHGRRKPTAFIVTLHFKFKRKLTRGLGQCAALVMTFPHGNRWHCSCILYWLRSQVTRYIYTAWLIA